MPLAQLADPWQKMAVESPSDSAEVSAAGRLVPARPLYVALCASKARHRLSSESVSWYLETLFLRLPSLDGAPSLPLLSPFLSFMFLPTSFRRQWAAFLGA